MEDIMCIKDELISLIKSELDEGTEHICTKEMGEVVDMVRDLSETAYYLSIVEAMQNGDTNIAATTPDQQIARMTV